VTVGPNFVFVVDSQCIDHANVSKQESGKILLRNNRLMPNG
jgi:hypothetical protein